MNTHLMNYHRHRETILDRLGNSCSECGSQDDLQIDHVNPDEKTLEISANLTTVEIPDRVWKELEKCQLLCSDCHFEKSTNEASHPVLFRGKRFSSKRAAVRFFEIGFMTFYREYHAPVAERQTRWS